MPIFKKKKKPLTMDDLTHKQSMIVRYFRKGYRPSEVQAMTGSSDGYVRQVRRECAHLIDDPEVFALMTHRNKTAGQKQKMQDQLRVERKQFREEIRFLNTLEEIGTELVDALKSVHAKGFNTVKHEDPKRGYEGIFQVSDIHFNELINLPFNQFDFPIACKRLKKYVIKAKKYFKAYGIKTVWIAFTGDMINSDRRLDEQMNMATNRARASVLAAFILKQVILDLNKDFNLKIVMVTGNEPRMAKELGSSEMMMSDNYDYLIHEMLKLIFDNRPGIEFLEGNCVEQVIEVKGHKILLIHGHQVKMSQVSSQIQRIKGKWSDYKEQIDYVLFGNFHTARVTDLFARSGGLCGANAYSDNQLQLSSRASQNIFVVDREGIDGIKIDVQHYDDIEGYSIDRFLETYNPKSSTKVPWMVKKVI